MTEMDNEFGSLISKINGDIQNNIINLNDKISKSLLLTKFLLFKNEINHEIFNLCDNPNCGIHDGLSCQQYLQTILDNSLKTIVSGSNDEFISYFEEITYEINKKKKKIGARCEDSWNKIENKMFKILTNMKSYQNLIFDEKDLTDDDKIAFDLKNFDPDIAYTMIIEPLSNKNRLNILIEIYKGSRRFKELEDNLSLQAGHLLYHLNPLKKAGIITQDESKNYELTQKGIHLLKILSKIIHVQ